MINYVNGFLFSQDEKQIALIEKQRPAWQKGKLNGIGGKIREDEEPQSAMQREFEEETGVFIFHDYWHNFLTLYGKDWRVYFFKAFNDDIKNVRSNEDEEVKILRVHNLNEMGIHPIISNLRWIIPMALDFSVKYAEIEEV